MSNKKITMEYRDANMLLNVLELHEALRGVHRGSLRRIMNVINEGRANARGDYDLSLGDYEVTLNMRISDVRKLAEILDQRGTQTYDTTMIGYLIADVIERHEKMLAHRRRVSK